MQAFTATACRPQVIKVDDLSFRVGDGQFPSFLETMARVRVCSSRWAARRVHCICWRLAKRLLTTASLVHGSGVRAH